MNTIIVISIIIACVYYYHKGKKEAYRDAYQKTQLNQRNFLVYLKNIKNSHDLKKVISENLKTIEEHIELEKLKEINEDINMGKRKGYLPKDYVYKEEDWNMTKLSKVIYKYKNIKNTK